MDTQTASAKRDWHPADVKAALEKKGVSLKRLAADHGYSHIQRVLTSHWLAAEHIVAKALGLQPSEIWPSRYAQGVDRSRAASMTKKLTLPKHTQRRTRASRRPEARA